MNLFIALLALIVGYAFGSISFTRIMARRVDPEGDISKTAFDLPGTDKQYVMTSVSATSIFARAGAKSGCLVALLDMLKAFVPVMAFKLLFPGELYHLLTAVGTVTGHNFPMLHGFKGGRGISPLTGNMLAIDWLSVPVLFVLGNILGFGILRDAMGFYAGVVLLGIPWIWYRFGDWPHMATAIAFNIIFFIALMPELRQYIAFKRSGEFEKAAAFRAAQKSAQETADNEGLLMKYRRKFGLVKREN